MTTTVLAYIPSPSQGVWHLGPLPIRAYAFFIILGIVGTLIIGDRRWQQRGGEPGTVYDMVFWAVGFGLIGGRLYHVITDWDKYFTDNGPGFVGALKIWDGGLGIWGAVALGGVGAWIGCRRRGIPLPAFGDAIAPGIILAQAIGRLGNYFNQELYGGPTTLPWGLELYERRDASGALDTLNGVSTGQLIGVVHPTFLYELLWNLLVFAALILIDRRFKIGHGRLFALYVAGYCFGRFWIELIRVDEANGFAGIRINSFTSTFVFIGAVIYIMVAPKGREDPASLKGKPREVDGESKAPAEEDTSVEEFVKELTGVAPVTTGLVAAAKVAGEAEDEDAKAVAEEPEDRSEAAVEAEALTADIAEAPSEDIAEAEEFAEAKEEAEQAEADALAEDVAEAPSEEIAEAEEAAAGGEAEPVGGVGAVEGEEAVEAEEAAPEAHEAAVDAAEEANDVAAEAEEEAEATEEPEAEEPQSEDAEAAVEAAGGESSEEEAVEEPEPTDETETEAEEDAEEDAEAQAVETEEPETAGAEADESEAAEEPEPTDDSEAEPESEDAEAAVEDSEGEPSEEEVEEEAESADEADEDADDSEAEDAEAAEEDSEAELSDEEAAEAAESVAEEAEATEEQEPEAEVLAEAAEPEPAEPESVEDVDAAEQPRRQAQESGGRLRRWLQSRRG